MTTTVTVNSLGMLLKVWREDAGLTAREVAARATAMLPGTGDVSRATLYRYEANQFPASGPDALVLAAIARACGRRVGELPTEVLDLVDSLAELLRKNCSSEAA